MTVEMLKSLTKETCTDPFLYGHKAGELRQDGELFAQIDDEVLQLCFLPLWKWEKVLKRA